MSKSEIKSKDLAALSIAQLIKDFALLKKELFNLRFQKTLGELANTSRFTKVRKDIARIKTELTRRKRLEQK